ncbi:MAG: single-stranded-DNA-specific exonuclease RecJ [Chitinophagales bacterium]
MKNTDVQKADALQRVLRIHPVLCRLLVQRGIDSYEKAKMFFRPELHQLHNPFLMKDMQKAVDRITQAMAANERILIYGDYDVDGTTAVSLVFTFLRKIYPNIDFYIPDRYKEGYGISFNGVDYARQQSCTLIIALDCGIKANDKIDYANRLGIDFIICDHHLPGEKIPEAFAILDPHQPGCNYPCKELSGCGIGFKLAQALASVLNIPESEVYPLLDLVVISIASDIVPIINENRIMAFYGLDILNKNPRPGIRALMKVSGIAPPVSVSNIVFGLGPRINAAGRLDDAKQAVRMLLSEAEIDAQDNADELQEHNNNRREIDKQITAEALAMLDSDPDTPNKKTTVLCSEAWHKGVIGIVASRVLDSYYRPTIMLTQSNGLITGSARSVKGFDIYEAIKECSDLLEQFGGHMYAAGVTLKPENLEAFKMKFEDVVSKRILPEQLIPELEIDAEIQLSDISPAFFNILKQFAPFGPENMYPVFMTNNVMSNGRTKLVGNGHLKLGLKDNRMYAADAIAWQQGDLYDKVSQNKPFGLCYTIEENIFNNNTTLQLNVRALRFNADI